MEALVLWRPGDSGQLPPLKSGPAYPGVEDHNALKIIFKNRFQHILAHSSLTAGCHAHAFHPETIKRRRLPSHKRTRKCRRIVWRILNNHRNDRDEMRITQKTTFHFTRRKNYITVRDFSLCISSYPPYSPLTPSDFCVVSVFTRVIPRINIPNIVLIIFAGRQVLGIQIKKRLHDS